MNKTIHVLNKRVALAQPDGGFQTSIDAVLLAAACPAQGGQAVLDLGCGVGAAALSLHARVAGLSLHGVEILPREGDLARHNAAQNQADLTVIEANIKTWRSDDLRVDHVVMNPPYLTAGAHLKSPDGAKANAMGHIDPDVSLHDWIMSAHYHLKSQGSLTIVHRMDALQDILTALGRRFGAIEIIPLWPKQGQPSKRVIIRAIKDRKTPLICHAGLVLHQQNGDYTNAAEAILRDIQPLYI